MWFDHPHFFLPERWLDDAARHIPAVAYMPFGFGSIMCPNKASLQELYVATVKVRDVDVAAAVDGGGCVVGVGGSGGGGGGGNGGSG